MKKLIVTSLVLSLFTSLTLAQTEPLDCRKVVKVVNFQELSKIKFESTIVSDATVQAKALIQLYENNYGPLLLKPFTTGLDWNKMKTELLDQVAKAESTNDLHFIFHDFQARFDDGHVSNPIPSSLSMRLPLDFIAVEKKILIAGLNPSLYPKDQRAPKKGDEIIEINGKPIAEFQNKFLAWKASGNEQANLAIFALSLTRWSERGGIPVSTLNMDSLNLKLQTIEGEFYEVRVPFKKEGLGIIGRDIDLKDPAPPVVEAKDDVKINELERVLGLNKNSAGTKKILNSVHTMFKAHKNDTVMNSKPVSADSARMVMGEPTPFFKLPADFKPISFPLLGMTKEMLGGDVLMGGTFKRNGKTIGFLRIGSYSISNFMMMELSIRRMIGQLNKLTDTLIIDQTNNPGGYVIFADLLIRSLAGKLDESKHMKFAVKPTQEFLRQYAGTIQEIKKNEDGKLTDEQVQSFSSRLEVEYKKIYQAYIEGRNLSDPVSMVVFSEYFAIVLGDQLLSDPVTRFAAKTLLGEEVLTPQVFEGSKNAMCSQLCFSGGDAFIALFQDYNLGRTYGLTTGAAGGTVVSYQLNGLIPLEGTITNSLMVRKNGAFVENYGVTPQYYLSIQRNDVVNNYADFFERALKTMGF